MKTGSNRVGNVVFTTSCVVMFLCIIVGSLLKILHENGADVMLAIGLIASAVFIVIALYEVHSSKVSSKEKVLWTVGFLLMSGVTGIVYLVIGRNKVLKSTVN